MPLAPLAIALAAACGRRAPDEPRAMELVKPHVPAAGAPFAERVYLNEALTFSFSEPLERTSVTRDSVRITDELGTDARGRLEVHGSSVRFVPDLPTSADLADAGLAPGRTYSVELAGFPRLDCLRSLAGHPLVETVSTSFTTVSAVHPSGEPRTWLLFDDDMPAKAGVLTLFPAARGPAGGAYVVAGRGAIVLTCDKPIDPTTIRESDFLLQPADGPNAAPIEVAVRLLENEPRNATRPRPASARARGPAGWERLRRAALLEITPRRRPPPGALLFTILTDTNNRCRMLDLGGQPILWASQRVTVQFVDSAEAAPGSFSEEFLRSRAGSLRSQAAVPGFDGTAWWNDSGRVEVRYPAAAGDGADGEVALAGDEPRADVRATRIELAPGATCRLVANAPVCVLRSQGALTISGALERDAPGAARDDALDPALGEEHGETLSSWLARAQTRGRPWTVLIAGGDLTIDGSLRVGTPLLLCAGGRIRIPGQVRGVGTEKLGGVWILDDGGGLDVQPKPNLVRTELVIDAPQGPNPLRRPLALCVMSQTLPQRGGVARWLHGEALGSEPGSGRPNLPPGANGSWRVRYLPASALPDALGARESWLDDPAAIPIGPDGRAEPLVFLVELSVPVGGRWAPPFVDSVRLAWEEFATAGGLR